MKKKGKSVKKKLTAEKPKKKKKSKVNHYFTQVHEDAIIQYAQTEDNKIRTKLYVNLIGPVFDEMVDKIIFTYKFNTTLPNIEVLGEECKIHLTTILNKFDASKNYKAFSYFTVITRNWFFGKQKKNRKASKLEIQYEDATNEIEQTGLVDRNPYEDFREYREFWNHLWSEIDSWEEKMNLKENDKKVYEAVVIVLNSIEDIELFNKKAIYLYLREITKLNTKQIVNSLNKMRKFYVEFRKKWNEGKI